MSNPDAQEEKDINAVFEDILLSEERIIEEGYREGFQKGASEGNVEGYHLGYHRGAELGAELGYYSGVAEAYLLAHNREKNLSDKNVKHLVTLINLVNDFPTDNNKEIDILQLADNIRTLFKKVCALLKIKASYPEVDGLSF